MARRTLLDVADLVHGRVPGYCLTTKTRRGDTGSLGVTWCTEPGRVVTAHANTGPRVVRWVVRSVGGGMGKIYTGRGRVERMAADIVAAVHEDARRHGRWGPEVWAEVTR